MSNKPTVDFSQLIQNIIDVLTRRQADAMAKRIAATYVLGYKNSGTKAPLTLQENAIQKLSAESLGYIAEYNDALGKQLQTHLQETIRAGGGYEDVKKAMVPYILETFGEGGVTIDRVGQTRTIIEVGKDGSLQRVEKPITQPYTASVDAYSDMLSRTVTHTAYEKGRAQGYISQGRKSWRFVGPVDERSRPWHVALIGNIYEYDTPESDMALDILSEPNCRHRAIPVFENDALNTPQETYDKRKEAAGLAWINGKWGFKE